MVAEISPSPKRYKRYGAGMYEAFASYVKPREVSPDRCPTCGHEGRSRATQSLRFETGFRQRRRRCLDCGATWFTVELSRDALLGLREQLQEAEETLAHSHAANLDGAVDGIRHALKALEDPYRAHQESKNERGRTSAKRGPQRARVTKPHDQG